MLRLHLVRHAHAVDLADDAARPLSARGREQVRQLGKFLRRTEAFQPEQIWHSPLVRARETATLLARSLRLDAPLVLTPGLAPEDDPRPVARRLRAAAGCIAIVGHEPHLSALASLLLRGRAAPPAVVMRKCAALTLEGAGRHWLVRWHVSPELFA
ncbi:MAG: histidine phosphatase family protein [Opitutaceae bacterium]|nr:histidine phosphatase family protein [Opitutaceae bacterium]